MAGHCTNALTTSGDCTNLSTEFLRKDPAVAGSWGEYAAIQFGVATKKFVPHVVRFGSKVTVEAVIHPTDNQLNALGVTAFTVESWTGGLGTWAKFDKVSDAENIPDATALTEMYTCDTTKWTASDACQGVTTWKWGSHTAPTATTDGTVQFYHYLADQNPTDAAKVF